MQNLDFPEIRSIGNPIKSQTKVAPPTWPADTTIVSADGHWLEGDLWIDRFQPELKHRAPRMIFENGGWQITIDGTKPPFPDDAKMPCTVFECHDGMSNVTQRMQDLDLEGMDKELLFPEHLFGFYVAGDVELRESVFGAHSRYFPEICSSSPDRLFFVQFQTSGIKALPRLLFEKSIVWERAIS